MLTPAELLASVSEDSPLAAKSRRLDVIASAVHSRMRSESASSLLSLLCLLDTPTSVAQLMALRSRARSATTLNEFTSLAEKTIVSMLSSLEKAGAIVWRDEPLPTLGFEETDPTSCFELHPVLRVRLSERLRSADLTRWLDMHGELSAFFAGLDAEVGAEGSINYSLAAARHSLLAGDVKEGFRHY